MHEKNECTTCNLEKLLSQLPKEIEGASWEYPAYLSIPSPTLEWVNFGIEFDGENTHELLGNDYAGMYGDAITLRGDETKEELKKLVLNMFKTIHETEGAN